MATKNGVVVVVAGGSVVGGPLLAGVVEPGDVVALGGELGAVVAVGSVVSPLVVTVGGSVGSGLRKPDGVAVVVDPVVVAGVVAPVVDGAEGGVDEPIEAVDPVVPLVGVEEGTVVGDAPGVVVAVGSGVGSMHCSTG